MIDVYGIVRNEEFLLPYFLRHYETFAYRIFICDDHTTDRTREIAKTHAKVSLLDYPANQHPESWTSHQRVVRSKLKPWRNSVKPSPKKIWDIV